MEELPSSIGNMRGLVRLFVEDCNLKFIPNTIGNLTGLKALYLMRNKMKKSFIYNKFNWWKF